MLRPGEHIEDLQRDGLKIIQHRGLYRFSIDSVVLAHFVKLSQDRPRIIDMGTGSGVVMFLLSSLYPEASFTGIEIQEQLADMASRSVSLNELEDRIKVVHGDVREIKNYVKPNSAHAVVSNPPYIPEKDGGISSNRSIAVAKQELEAQMEDFMRAASFSLKGRGSLFMVHRSERLVDICWLARQHDLEPKSFRPVYSKSNDDSGMMLFECVKNARPKARMLPPLELMDSEGNYSPEIKKIFLGDN